MKKEELLTYNHSAVNWDEELFFPNTRTFAQLSHRIFNRYPARSINLVPRSIIISTQKTFRRRLRVLDPFMGSGTTAVEAVLANCEAFGVEIDPLARLISDVRVQKYSRMRLKEIFNLYQIIHTKWIRTEPDNALRPKLRNATYWFDNDQYMDLLSLKTCIYNESIFSKPIHDFFRIVLADIIRPCSKAERQTLKPYISKKYKKTPTPVQQAFAKSFHAHYTAIKDFEAVTSNGRPNVIEWLGFDATDYSSRKKMDVAITSPPYTNALDYVRCIKLESAWVDCGDDSLFATLRKGQVGEAARSKRDIEKPVLNIAGMVTSRISKVDPTRGKTVLSYFNDIYRNLYCTYRSLRRGGCYHMIIGDSIIRGVPVHTHKIIISLGEVIGFEWSGYYKYRIRDHRTSIPRKGNGGKITYEYVVSLKKT